MGLTVCEIFLSLQGESTYAGYPCVFVRLTGCNLRCSYCDTQYAYTGGEVLSITEIVERVDANRCPLVEVTGGEPLLQDEVPDLILCLLEKVYKVLVETNGSMDISKTDPRAVRILDIKCPSSGQAMHNDLKNLKRLTEQDEVKFVIGDRKDYEYARDIVESMRADGGRGQTIRFSPVHGELAPQTMADWIIEDCLGVKLSMQLHKILWGDERSR